MRHAGKTLLVDNSNSFTKLALTDGERLLGTRRLPTRALTADGVRRVLGRWKFERVVLSSVVPEKGRAIEEAMEGRPLLRVSAKIDLGVTIDYPRPASIGADRLANAATRR